MIKKWGFILIGSIGVLIFGFQNCGQKNGAIPKGSTMSDKIGSLASESVSSQMTSPVTSPVTSIEMPLRNGSFVVSVDDGTASLNTGGLKKNLSCINETDIEDLRSFTASYDVCDVVKDDNSGGDSGEVCTTEYQPPYVSLITENLKINLGEAFDGCGRGSRDLCGDKAELFRSFISALKQKCNLTQ